MEFAYLNITGDLNNNVKKLFQLASEYFGESKQFINPYINTLLKMMEVMT